MERYLGGLERQFYQQNLVGSTNICTVLRLRGSLDRGRLQEATRKLGERHPLLRASIVADPCLRFCMRDAPPSPAFHVEPMLEDNHWRRILELELHRSYKHGQGLGHVQVLEGEQGFDILLSLNHALADGLSSSYLCRALLLLYQNEPLSPATAGLPMETRFPPAHRGLRGWWKTLRYIFKLSKLGPALQVGHADWTQATLSSGFVFHHAMILNAQAREQGSNLFALISALTLKTIHELYGNGAAQNLSLNTPVSLRSGVGAGPDEVGLFIAGHMALYRIEPGMDIWELARQCHHTLKAGVESGDPYCLARLARGSRKPKAPVDSPYASQHRPTVSISNLGRIEDFPVLPDAIVYEHHALSAQSVKDPFALVLLTYQDRLHVDLQTSREKMGSEAGRMILQRLEEQMQALLPSAG